MTKTFYFTLHDRRVKGQIHIEPDGFTLSVNGAPIAGIVSSGVLTVWRLSDESIAAAQQAGLAMDKTHKRIELVY